MEGDFDLFGRFGRRWGGLKPSGVAVEDDEADRIARTRVFVLRASRVVSGQSVSEFLRLREMVGFPMDLFLAVASSLRLAV